MTKQQENLLNFVCIKDGQKLIWKEDAKKENIVKEKSFNQSFISISLDIKVDDDQKLLLFLSFYIETTIFLLDLLQSNFSRDFFKKKKNM